jgi:lipopolysaccharide/colanic/teichoic acid biosynthesis glycosyltransferase
MILHSSINFILAFLIFLVISPALLGIGLLLWVYNRGEVLYTQKRIGKNGVEFKILKFKTLTDERDETGWLLPVEQRMTKVGAFLRKYSLDEFPQIFNVLRGDMNLVGPRPLPPEYLPLYSAEQNRRHLVKPGITGWTQVNGRNQLTWQRKFELDVWYVDNRSIGLDFKILALTFLKILKENDGDIVPESFNGQN